MYKPYCTLRMRVLFRLKSFTHGMICASFHSSSCSISDGRCSTDLGPSSSLEVTNAQKGLKLVGKPPFPEVFGSCYYFKFLRPYAVNNDLNVTPRGKETTQTLHTISSSSNSRLEENQPRAISISSNPKDDKKHPTTYRQVKSLFKKYLLNTSVLPLSKEELINWRLDRSLHLMDLPMNALNPGETNFWLPRDVAVTSLGPKMDLVDSLYRRAGWYTPSEVAQVLIGLTPTFFVEARYIIGLIPPNLLLRIESRFDRKIWVNVLFGSYPMLFVLHKPNFFRPVVKLNTEMWFVRAHPDFKKGNRLHYKHNAEHRADVGGVMFRNAPTGQAALSGCDTISVRAASKNEFTGLFEAPSSGKESSNPTNKSKPIDSQIFEILISHLPRVPSTKVATRSDNSFHVNNYQADQDVIAKMRYKPMPLVEWVNGFPQQELDILNTVSQEHVLTILQEYPLIFQLMHPKGESPFLYSDREVLSRFFPSVSAIRVRGSLEKSKAEPMPCAILPDGQNRGEDLLNSWMEHQSSDNEASIRSGRPELTESYATRDVQTREEQLFQALQDDLIGIDDLAQGLDQNCEEDKEAQDLVEDPLGQDGDLLLSDPLDNTLEKDTDSINENYDPELQNDGDEGYENNIGSQHTTGVDYTAVSSKKLGELCIRRLPPEIAPRSLSNFNHLVSPTPELVEFVASFLAPPPSISKVPNNFFVRCQIKFNPRFPTNRRFGQIATSVFTDSTQCMWRWVRVQTIYMALSFKQRQEVRQTYRGLVNLLRLHGELFEVSEDFMHVIAHDPKGVLAPIVPTQKTFRFQQRVVLPASFDDDLRSTAALIGEEARQKYKTILGDSQIPTTRNQLSLLDPHNPLLFREVLYDEISQLLPHDRPISRMSLMSRMPPIMRAAMGRTKLAHAVLSNYITIFQDNGITMLQRKHLGKSAVSDQPQLSLEDSVEELRAAVPVCGATITALKRLHLSKAAVEGLNRHFGSIHTAVKSYPQYFNLSDSPTGKISDALVTIVK